MKSIQPDYQQQFQFCALCKCVPTSLVAVDPDEEEDTNPPDDPDAWRDECDDPAREDFRD